MAVSMISQNVWNQVYARLSAPSGGFNDGLAANAVNYGLSTFIQVSWTAPSNNFFPGQVDFQDLETSGILKYPAACLYILESANANLEKFHQFSGPVRCVFEVGLSWTSIKGQVPFDSYANCVEDVVIDVVNRMENQDWTNNVSYNGQIQCKRGPITFGAQNYRQKVGFSMMFEVDTNP
jgi:hypothetical protein